MNYISYFFRKGILAFLVIFLSGEAHAAQRLSLHRVSEPELKRLTGEATISTPMSAMTTTTTSHPLRLLNEHTDPHQVTHSRMQQEYEGIPVLGGNVILHRTAKGALFVNGVYFQGLKHELGKPASSFKSDAQQVLEQFVAQYNLSELKEKEVLPIVYVDDEQHAHWAYRVSAYIEPDNALPSRPTAIIEAGTQITLKTWNDLKTIRTLVNGVGYGGNQNVGRYLFGESIPLLKISRDDLIGHCYLENTQVRVVDMAYSYGSNRAPMTFDCGELTTENAYWTGYDEDGLDLRNGSYSPSNDALYIGGVIQDMYQKVYGVNALGRSKASQLIMRVHYGRDYANAFWDGYTMTFGDGDKYMHPLVSLGIGAHEVSHGFTDQHSRLQYEGQSGAMNESFSDMAAQAAEYYVKGASSWTLGAEIMKKDCPVHAFRYMDVPSRDGHSIDDADEYYDKIDVHYGSGVYNHLFYLISNRPGWDPTKAFRVMVKANMDYWTETSTFDEGACGILFAAEDLALSSDDIKKSMDEVHIDYQNCSK